MNAHGVEIFDRADNYALILVVAHHLHLVFLPTKQALLNQNLINGRGIQPLAQHLFKFNLVVCNPASRAPQRVSGAQNNGKIPEVLDFLAGFVNRMDAKGMSDVQADIEHSLLEKLSVLPLPDCLRFCPDHLDPMLFQDSLRKELKG